MILLQEMFKKHPHNQYFLVRGACFYHEKVRTLDYKGVRTGILCGFEFYRTAILKNHAQKTKGVSCADESPFIGKVKAILFFSDFPPYPTQCFPMTDAMHCVGHFNALRWPMQCLAMMNAIHRCVSIFKKRLQTLATLLVLLL